MSRHHYVNVYVNVNVNVDPLGVTATPPVTSARRAPTAAGRGSTPGRLTTGRGCGTSHRPCHHGPRPRHCARPRHRSFGPCYLRPPVVARRKPHQHGDPPHLQRNSLFPTALVRKDAVLLPQLGICLCLANAQ